MLLVPSQGVHLQVEEVHRVFSSDGLSFLSFTVRMTLSLLSDCLDDRLVKLTNVVVFGLRIKLKLQLPLSNSSLNSLAVACIAGWSVAGATALQQATVLGAAVATMGTSFFHSSSVFE